MASFYNLLDEPMNEGGITWGQLLGIANRPQQQVNQPTFMSFNDFFTPARGQALLYNTKPTQPVVQRQQQPLSWFDWLTSVSQQGGNEGGVGTESGVSAPSDMTETSEPDGGFE